MDQLELLQDHEVDDFGVFDGLAPFDFPFDAFPFNASPADFPGFVDGPLPDDPGDGSKREACYKARLNQYLDVVADDQKQLAMRTAHQARSIDAARMWSLVSDEYVLCNPGMSDTERAEWAHRAFVTEIGALRHEPDPTAARLIDESHSLVQELPATLAALETGSISYRHAQVILNQAGTLPADVRADFEEALLPHALRLPTTQLRRKAVALRERLHPDSILARKRVAMAERRLAFEAAPDGMAWLNLFGPAADVLAAITRVDEVARLRQDPTEPRTLAQLRADVAIELLHDGELFEPGELTAELQGIHDDVVGGSGGDPAATRKPARKRSRKSLRGIRPTVIVTVPAFTLMGLSEEPASLDGYGPIDPDTARTLCAKAPSFLRLMVHPETGVPLSLGTEHYRVPKDLKIWLQMRDGTCRRPNCGQPAVTSEIDHTIARAFGGPTDAINLAHLCKACHRLKHATTWHPVQRGDGVINWTSPTGRVFTTWPALDLPGTSLPELGLRNTEQPELRSIDSVPPARYRADATPPGARLNKGAAGVSAAEVPNAPPFPSRQCEAGLPPF